MIRLLLLGSLFLTGLGSLACESYTTTLVESPRRVDERVVISTMRSVAQAQMAYSLSNSGDYGSFQQLVSGGHLDHRFSSSQPQLGGYILTMTVANRSSGGEESSYHCNADPDPKVNPAGRHFYLGSTSLELRVNATKTATTNDEAFQP